MASRIQEPREAAGTMIEGNQTYDFSIEHRKVGSHGNADVMPHCPYNLECRHCSKEAKEDIIDISD